MKRQKLYRWRWAILAGAGLMPFVSLSGCDPTVKTQLLTGIQTSLTGLVTSLMNAFFMALQNTATDVTSQPTVMHTFDALKTWIA